MSDSYKDKRKATLKRYYKDRWDIEYVRSDNPYVFLELAGVKSKKRKEVDVEDHWMNTPSWWNNLFHTRPIRGKFNRFSRIVLKSSLDEIELILEPEDSRSPHKYFW